MKNVNKFLSYLGVTLTCFAVASSAAYAAVAGHVQFVNGDVQIVGPAGQARPLQKGDAVNEGDTLTSAPAASAQIKMQDGGFVAMRPDTSLKFDQFVYSGKQDGSEKSFFSLFKGGFRAVTGLIGQINKQNYKITTSAATIGIRGTDHETMLITPGSPMALVAPAGAYSKVNVGETTLTTNRGVINVMPNQMGFAGGMDQAPKLQPLNTGIFTVAPAPAVRADKKEEKKEEKTEAKQEQKTAKNEEKKEGGEKSKQESTATESKPASTDQTASTSTEQAPVVAAAPQETVAPIRSAAVVDAVAPAAGLIPSTVAPVMAAPVALAPVISPPPTTPQNVQITTVPQNGTTVNLTTGTATTSTGQVIVAQQPTLATCTVNPAAAGCTAVLPTVAACTANPAAAGCSAVLPTIATCTANPAAAGCTAVLPTVAACTANPAAAGCTAVLPTIATCTANPAAAGCTAVLPTIATCTVNSTAAGCTAVLPSLATCTANPAAAGCSVVLPTIATCSTNPAAVGCAVVLPTIATCAANPAAAGCSAVLPTIATCTANPAAAGCSAVLPTIATCSANPTAAGCTAVLPTIATCSTNPASAGCSAVLPTQAYVQTDVSVETSVNNGYATYNGPMFYSGNSMTAAANVAPLANPPSFTMNYGCFSCGTDTVTLPGATGAVNGNANSFATTGIQFGRWINAPSISQTSTYTFAPGQNNIGNSSSGWAFAPGGYLDTPTALSAATGGTNAMGVFNYVLNGAPAPRDQNGAAGTLNSLSLAANFTTQTVTAALSASLGATTWTANSAAMGIYAANFGGALTVTSNAVCAAPPCVNMGGYLNGAFTSQNYAGAIASYNIYEFPLAGGATSTNLYGVAALTRNSVVNPLAPPPAPGTPAAITFGNAVVVNGTAAPTGNFVVTESGGMSGSFVQTVNTATTTAGVLTGYSSNFGAGNTSSTSIACTTCTGQAATDTATGIQYGIWDAGSRTYSYTSPFGGQFHWIKGAGLDPVYLPEVLTGTMAYTLDGGTVPTNQNGLAGSLSSASLAVNFTSQTVDIALGMTGVNGHNWTASSTGTPLSWTNYSKNGFSANSGTTQGGGLSVTMDGATAGTGYLSGQLTGSGLNGALFQYQLSAPLPMPTVPGTFTATDMVTVQVPSVLVTGPVTTGGPVSVVFPTGASGTLAVQPATTLNVTLTTAGVPAGATLTGGIAASVATLTADLGKQGVYYGTEATTGQSVSVATSGYLVSNSGLASGLKYSNFGEWRMLPTPVGVSPVTATGPFTSGEFAGGMLPTSTMPTGGFAVNGYYYGVMVGGAQDGANNTPYSLSNGWLAMNANFTTGTLSGSATNIQVRDQNTGSFTGYFNDLSLTAAIASNAFSGSVTAGSNPAGTTASPVNLATGATGTTSGHFYGPNANELTGIFGLASGTIKASGAFGAGNGTSNSTPFETVNGTVALVAAAPANTATPYRLIGMSAYDPAVSAFNGGLVLDGGYNNTARVTEDVAGNVTVFDSGFGNGNVNYNNSASLAINTATPAGLGTDPVSGISWGRWVGGSISMTDRTTGVVKTGVNAGSLHWIAGPGMTAPVALPTSGTYTYVLAGGTAPTDNLGNIGTLNSASLVANFTAQTVNVGVNVGINNVSGTATLNASATNIPIQQRSMFDARTAGLSGGSSGLLNATCTGAGCSAASPVQAKIGGAFTGATGQGAAMTYGFNNGSTVVNGVAAFHR